MDYAVGLLVCQHIAKDRWGNTLSRPRRFPRLEIWGYSSQKPWPSAPKGWMYVRGQWRETLGYFMGSRTPIAQIETELRMNSKSIRHYIEDPPATDGIEDLIKRTRFAKRKGAHTPTESSSQASA